MRTTGKERVFWGVGLLIVLCYALIPVLWILSVSLKPDDQIADGRFIPKDVTFEHYTKIFDAGFFTDALRNSLGIAAISTIIAITLGAMAAYALSRLEFPGKRVILVGALAIAMFPPISIVGSLFDIWKDIGLFDTWLGLIIPYMTFSLPLAIYALTAFFREIPKDLEEAAMVDGATPFQAFRKVILPLAAPGMFTAGVLVFIFAWNDFVFAITLTSSDASRTVPAALAFFTGGSQFADPTGSISAAAIVLTIPIVILVLIFQRRIVAGLTSGAVKG